MIFLDTHLISHYAHNANQASIFINYLKNADQGIVIDLYFQLYEMMNGGSEFVEERIAFIKSIENKYYLEIPTTSIIYEEFKSFVIEKQQLDMTHFQSDNIKFLTNNIFEQYVSDMKSSDFSSFIEQSSSSWLGTNMFMKFLATEKHSDNFKRMKIKEFLDNTFIIKTVLKLEQVKLGFDKYGQKLKSTSINDEYIRFHREIINTNLQQLQQWILKQIKLYSLPESCYKMKVKQFIRDSAILGFVTHINWEELGIETNNACSIIFEEGSKSFKAYSLTQSVTDYLMKRPSPQKESDFIDIQNLNFLPYVEIFTTDNEIRSAVKAHNRSYLSGIMNKTEFIKMVNAYESS